MRANTGGLDNQIGWEQVLPQSASENFRSTLDGTGKHGWKGMDEARQANAKNKVENKKKDKGNRLQNGLSTEKLIINPREGFGVSWDGPDLERSAANS